VISYVWISNLGSAMFMEIAMRSSAIFATSL